MMFASIMKHLVSSKYLEGISYGRPDGQSLLQIQVNLIYKYYHRLHVKVGTSFLRCALCVLDYHWNRWTIKKYTKALSDCSPGSMLEYLVFLVRVFTAFVPRPSGTDNWRRTMRQSSLFTAVAWLLVNVKFARLSKHFVRLGMTTPGVLKVLCNENHDIDM